jgi:peptide/nickel transport system permease protein
MASLIPASGPATAPAAKSVSPQQRALARLRRSPLAWLSGGFVVLLCVLTAGVQLWFPASAPFQITNDIMQPPSGTYWLGTDDLGRSLLLLIVWGARVSLTVGIVSASVAAIIGIVVGATSAYLGGYVDAVVMRVTEFFQVMPIFVLGALIVAMAGPGETRVIFVIAGLAWPQTARVIRAEVLRIKTLGYVEAARCLGIPETRILLREVIPNALAPVIAVSTLTAAFAILLEAALSFFGLTSSDTISWGLTLSSGQRLLYQAWWLSAFPGLMIFLTALAFNLFGDCVREALDPRDDDR